MLLKRLLLSFLLLLSLFTLAFAQNESQDDGEAIRIDTELIQLDVIVTDKNGHIVDKLNQEDFEITEEGKKQSISFFSLIRPQITENIVTSNNSPNSSINPDKKTNIDVAMIEKSGRVFIILVDDLHISPINMLSIKKQLFSLTDKEFQEGDRIAVVTSGGGLGFLQQLTDDRRVVHKAIEKLVGRLASSTFNSDPAKLTEYQAQRINDGDPTALELGVMNYIKNTGVQTPEGQVRTIVQTTARQVVEALAFRTTNTLDTIRNAILSVKSIPGRKTLILVTDGFLLEPKEADHFAQMRRIVDSATKAGVVVYSLGSAGLTVGGPNDPSNIENRGIDTRGIGFSLSSQERVAILDGMKAIAQDTGGFSIVNSNDLLGGLKNIVTESSSYYLVAYYPEDSQKDGKFRDIKVTIKGDKKLVVKTRKGYFAGEEKVNPKELAKKLEKSTKDKKPVDEASLINSELVSSISNVLPVKDINLKVKSDFLGVIDDNKHNTVFSFAINLKDIKFNKSDNRYINKLTALFIVIGEDGKIAHSTTNAVDVKFVDAQYERLSQSWFFYGTTLLLKPGFYNVRFAVRDPITKRLGSVSGWVEVPNLEKSKMTVSNILLLHEEDTKQITAKGKDSITGTGQALTIFSEKSSLGFVCYIFNAPKAEKLTAQIQVLKNNKAIFTSSQINVAEKPDEIGRIAYSGQLPLAGFPQGEYRLKITISSDSKNKVQMSQEQSFTIEN